MVKDDWHDNWHTIKYFLGDIVKYTSKETIRIDKIELHFDPILDIPEAPAIIYGHTNRQSGRLRHSNFTLDTLALVKPGWMRKKVIEGEYLRYTGNSREALKIAFPGDVYMIGGKKRIIVEILGEKSHDKTQPPYYLVGLKNFTGDRVHPGGGPLVVLKYHEFIALEPQFLESGIKIQPVVENLGYIETICDQCVYTCADCPLKNSTYELRR
jgi:hypothetical protein